MTDNVYSSASTLSADTEATGLQSTRVVNGGYQVIVNDSGGSQFLLYTLNAAYNLESGIYTSSFNYSTITSGATLRGFDVNPSGLAIYAITSTGDYVEFTLGTAFDITTISGGVVSDLNGDVAANVVNDCRWVDSGNKLLILGEDATSNNKTIYSAAATTPYTYSSLQLTPQSINLGFIDDEYDAVPLGGEFGRFNMIFNDYVLVDHHTALNASGNSDGRFHVFDRGSHAYVRTIQTNKSDSRDVVLTPMCTDGELVLCHTYDNGTEYVTAINPTTGSFSNDLNPSLIWNVRSAGMCNGYWIGTTAYTAGDYVWAGTYNSNTVTETYATNTPPFTFMSGTSDSTFCLPKGSSYAYGCVLDNTKTIRLYDFETSSWVTGNSSYQFSIVPQKMLQNRDRTRAIFWDYASNAPVVLNTSDPLNLTLDHTLDIRRFTMPQGIDNTSRNGQYKAQMYPEGEAEYFSIFDPIQDEVVILDGNFDEVAAYPLAWFNHTDTTDNHYGYVVDYQYNEIWYGNEADHVNFQQDTFKLQVLDLDSGVQEWDVDATYGSSVAITADPDGKGLYILQPSDDTVYRYSLSTAGDLTTRSATPTDTYDWSALSTSLNSVQITDPNGYYMVVGTSGATAPENVTMMNQIVYPGVSLPPGDDSDLDNTAGSLYSTQYGCQLRAKWDFSTSADTDKWTPWQEIYRYNRVRMAKVGFDPDLYDFDVIENKTKVRGNGKSIKLRFESEEGKDFELLGWAAVMTAPKED